MFWSRKHKMRQKTKRLEEAYDEYLHNNSGSNKIKWYEVYPELDFLKIFGRNYLEEN